jgi:hypothetical protein
VFRIIELGVCIAKEASQRCLLWVIFDHFGDLPDVRFAPESDISCGSPAI